MAWRAITENDILQRMSGDELAALRAAALDANQADPIATQIGQVTDFVRGYIQADSASTLGEAGTLPERLVMCACDILVYNIGSRVAGFLLDLNDTRKRAYETALKTLSDVARHAFVIEEPTTAGTDTVSAPRPRFDAPTTYFDSASQEGI